MDSAKTRGLPGEPTRAERFSSLSRYSYLATPFFVQSVVAWLDGTFKDGAVMTKIWKEVGMEVRRRDGSFVLPDDPVFDPRPHAIRRPHRRRSRVGEEGAGEVLSRERASDHSGAGAESRQPVVKEEQPT